MAITDNIQSESKPVVEEQKEQVVDYDIDQLFEDAYANQKHKNVYIKCIFWGPPESGKTYSALTFPGPIAYIDLDGGLDMNLQYHVDKDGNPTKEIKRLRCVSLLDDVENIEAKEYDAFKVDPLNTCKNFDIALRALQKKEGGTLIVDTMTAYNDWLKMLLESRVPMSKTSDGTEYRNQFDWKYVNHKWLWAWEKIKNVKANIVVIAKEKPIYQNREVTGNFQPDLRDGTEFQVDIVAQFKKIVEQQNDGSVKSKRVVNFSKFRGNALGHTYEKENLTYDILIDILREEEQIK